MIISVPPKANRPRKANAHYAHFSNLKIIGIGLIVFLGFLFSSPNFMDERTRFHSRIFPGGQLNLGLDLQGGSHLLLEVDTGVVQSERVEEIVLMFVRLCAGANRIYGPWPPA